MSCEDLRGCFSRDAGVIDFRHSTWRSSGARQGFVDRRYRHCAPTERSKGPDRGMRLWNEADAGGAAKA